MTFLKSQILFLTHLLYGIYKGFVIEAILSSRAVDIVCFHVLNTDSVTFAAFPRLCVWKIRSQFLKDPRNSLQHAGVFKYIYDNLFF